MKVYSKREIDSIHINRKAVKGKYYKGYDGILYQGQANGTVIRYHLNTITRTEIEWESDSEVYDQNLILSTSDKTYPGSNQRKYKICDGKKTWKQLDYFSGGGGAPALAFVSVDGITITGDGTPGNPLVAAFLAWLLSVTDDGNGVVSVDNTDALNPVIKFNGIYTDGVTITGDGTSGNPIVAALLAWVESVTDDGMGIISVDNTDPQNPIISFTGEAGDIPVDDSFFTIIAGTDIQSVLDSIDDTFPLYFKISNNLSEGTPLTMRTNLGVNEEVIGCFFGGGGGVINVSSIVTLISRFGGTITGWRVAGGNGETGSCVLDLKSAGVSMIGAGNKPTIVAGNTANASVSGWTSTTLTANGIYEITIDSLSSFRRLTVLFYFTRS